MRNRAELPLINMESNDEENAENINNNGAYDKSGSATGTIREGSP